MEDRTAENLQWVQSILTRLVSEGKSVRYIVNYIDQDIAAVEQASVSRGTNPQIFEARKRELYAVVDQELAKLFPFQRPVAQPHFQRPVAQSRFAMGEAQFYGMASSYIARVLGFSLLDAPRGRVDLQLHQIYLTQPLDAFADAVLDYIRTNEGMPFTERINRGDQAARAKAIEFVKEITTRLASAQARGEKPTVY